MNPHIVLTTFGSLGDLHPYLAIGAALRERGATVTIGTSEIFRENVLSEGLQFHAIRPDLAYMLRDSEEMRSAFHPRTGGNYLLKKVFLPWLEQSYEDTLAIGRDADVLVNHVLTFATPVVADLLRKPWVSVILPPSGILSAFDQPAISGAPFMDRLRWLGPPFWRTCMWLGKTVAARMAEPVKVLRKRIGVSATQNPLFDGLLSPHCRLACFSRCLANPQKDWARDLHITGFPFHDEESQGLSVELARFLDDGPPPIVFTLGSAAVFDAGAFYRESAEAAERIGRRAVLLIGRDPRNRPERLLPKEIIAVEYAPFAALFSRAAATVHQGGIGTTGQALRSGKPMLVVPWCHDQPDNARRIVNLGAGQTIARNSYSSRTAATALQQILENGKYETAAECAAEVIAGENGAAMAADLIITKAVVPNRASIGNQ